MVAWLFALGPGLKSLVLSLPGLRLTPSSLYSVSSSWWFVSLLIQCYLVFPLLWKLERRWGTTAFLCGACALGFAARAAGLLMLRDAMDPWLRGMIFVTRLPEFALGIAFARKLHADPSGVDARIRSPGAIVWSAVAVLAGTALALTRGGMVVAPCLQGVGEFGLLYPLLVRWGERGKVLPWLGVHSYAFYLVHVWWIELVIRHVPSRVGPIDAAQLALAAAATVLGGLCLERGTSFTEKGIARVREQSGLRGLLLRGAALAACAGILLLGAEKASRVLVPIELGGWGERPSLQPDPDLGWKLQPSATTRLRWESYDYTVRANSLGFPGPEYPATREPRSVRLLATGDAFTSAEGVDTEQAWPRLLEARLAQALSRKVEALNFAVTGYGPNQYLRVVEKFAPIYRPDLVLVEIFVNDFSDVLDTDLNIASSIGFSRPSPQGWKSFARLENFRGWVKLHAVDPLKGRLQNTPDEIGSLYGAIEFLERGDHERWTRGRELLEDRVRRIKTAADGAGARLLLVLVPAATQVCAPAQLKYFPAGVDLTDAQRYDLDRPQRLLKEIADRSGVPSLDLRPVLKASAECPYQPRNMHWTAAGHRAVAEHLAGLLRDNDSLLPKGPR
jgi:lysophospholipase L1-like esterase